MAFYEQRHESITDFDENLMKIKLSDQKEMNEGKRNDSKHHSQYVSI